MIELQPCPFCGGNATLKHDVTVPGYSYIECESCFTKSPQFYRSFERASDEDAKAFWNRRMADERIGTWKLVGAGKSGKGGIWICTACGKSPLHTSNYCPNCGAKMEVDNGKTH